jgi:hypothetical protein
VISDLFEKLLWLLLFVAIAFVLWDHQDWAKVVAIVGIVVAVLWVMENLFTRTTVRRP